MARIVLLLLFLFGAAPVRGQPSAVGERHMVAAPHA